MLSAAMRRESKILRLKIKSKQAYTIIMEFRGQKGFTLIELLVVISIVGLLSSVMIVALANVRANARDTRRLADMRQLVVALDLYYQNHGSYPLCTAAIGGGDEFCGSCDPATGTGEFETVLKPLVDDGILTKIPKDPLNKSWCYTYEYYTSNQPDIWSSECSSSAVGNFYYILRFSTERETGFNVPDWVYQRVSGKEYCMTGFKTR